MCTVDFLSKDIPISVWWSNYSQSNNHTPTEKNKPCSPLGFSKIIIRFPEEKGLFYSRLSYCWVRATSKKEKQTLPSCIIIDNVLLLSVQAVEDIYSSSQDCVSVFSVSFNYSDTFGDDLSFLTTESVSEDNSSVSHQFVNDSEFSRFYFANWYWS